MDRELHILIIEDTEDDYELLLREFKRMNISVIPKRIETAEAMRESLASQTWDIVISDFSLPQFNAPDALKILQASGLDIPFIIVSGTIGEESAVASLKAGAHDFLIKGSFARLAPVIERELREAESRRIRKEAEEALRENERLLSEAQRIGHVGSWSLLLANETLQLSEEMYRLLDMTKEEFNHQLDDLLKLVYSTDRPSIQGWIDNLRNGFKAHELDIRLFHRNSELRYIRFTGGPIFDSAGKTIRITGNAHDITENKVAEVQIQQQLKRLASLRTIDQAITSSFNLQFMLKTVVTQTISQLQVDAVAILLINESQQTLEYFIGQGFHTGLIEKTSLPLDKTSHAGKAVTTRQTLHIPDLKERPLVRDLSAEGFVSYFCVPLITKRKVNGVLEVFHRAPLQPYAEWSNFLETLAGQAAIAIDNATLFDELQRSNIELKTAYDATIEGWSHALDLRDRETEGHTRRVADMTLKLARIMGFTEEQLIHMDRGALLHDIGKMGVPDQVLLKEGSLTEDEWKLMRQHPKLAHDWLSPITYLQKALEIPYCHHEKWDGTGYPRGLKGKEIPLAARVFAIVDVWDALTSDRPYRTGWDKEKTAAYIREQSGKHFDPEVVDVFLDHLDELLIN